MKKLIKLYENWNRKRLLRHYHRLGQIYGDMISYTFMGDPYGMDSIEKKFHRVQRKCYELGCDAIPLVEWVDYGGYGQISPKIQKIIDQL